MKKRLLYHSQHLLVGHKIYPVVSILTIQMCDLIQVPVYPVLLCCFYDQTYESVIPCTVGMCVIDLFIDILCCTMYMVYMKVNKITMYGT